MTFHLPGKLFSVIVSNAETPFSSCWLKPGLTPVTLNASSLSPMVFMGSCAVDRAPGGATGTKFRLSDSLKPIENS
jgi:hypothetical protein